MKLVTAMKAYTLLCEDERRKRELLECAIAGNMCDELIRILNNDYLTAKEIREDFKRCVL